MNRKNAWLSAGLIGIVTVAALVTVIAKQAPDASSSLTASGNPSIFAQISRVARSATGSVSDSKDATAGVRIGDLNCAGIGRSADGSQIEKLYDCELKAEQPAPKEEGKVALAVLKTASPKLGIGDKDSSLELRSERSSKGVSHVRLTQHYKGLPVFGASVAVHRDKKTGQVLLVDSDALQNIDIKEVRPALDKGKAIAGARDSLGPKPVQYRDPSAELGVYPVAGKVGVLAYRTVFAMAKPQGVWEIMVDARTGEVINKRDLALGLDGVGRAYEPNPVVSGGTGLFTDNNDTDSFSLNNQRNLREFVSLDAAWQIDTDGDLALDSQILRGYWAASVGPGKKSYPMGLGSEAVEPISIFHPDFEPLECSPSPYNVPLTAVAPCFSYLRSDDRFEEANSYFHVTESQLYLQSLGFNDIRHQVTTSNVNFSPGGIQVQNAWFDAETKELYFGTLGVDAAEDADVINHEYGHAIQDDQVCGGLPPSMCLFPSGEEAGAIGEGFSDYFAFRRHYAYTAGPYDRECIAAWFVKSQPGKDCLRRIDTSRNYPGNMVYEPHEDGNIWSRALFDLFTKFGGTVADTLIIDSHNYLNPDATFSEAVQAIVRSDRVLYPNGSGGGIHENSIVDAFALRGIYPQPYDLDVPATVLTSGDPANVSWDRMGTPTAAYQLEYAENASATGGWTEDFEDGWISPVSWGLSYPAWFASSKWSKNGRFAARAARVGHGYYSGMHMTKYVTSQGAVEFDYRVSSEARSGLKSGDNLYFRACGASGCIQLGSWSGRTKGHFKIENLNSGWWVFSWFYSKDYSVSKGSDTAYVDNIQIRGVEAPTWKPLASLIPGGSDTFNWNAPLTPGYDYKLRIRGIARGSYTPWTYGPIFEVEEP